MSRPFNPPVTIPVSLLVLGLFMLSGSPTTFAVGLLLFLMAGMVMTVMTVLWKGGSSTTVAMVTSAPRLARLPSAPFVPNPWPNSGFRNTSTRRTSF